MPSIPSKRNYKFLADQKILGKIKEYKEKLGAKKESKSIKSLVVRLIGGSEPEIGIFFAYSILKSKDLLSLQQLTEANREYFQYTNRYNDLSSVSPNAKICKKMGLVANIPSNTKNYYSLISRHNSPYKYQTAYLQN